ncbi:MULTISPECIES: peroxiredoxin [Acinetobacter]|jgi:peroxiredoxin Q/BCP|uniref:thioredoxin-dependent peroxiredoxin n=1 Tax=Acinetobacter lwoffii TaxID=28090 RepID=A0A6N1L7W0_ACILW|nr:MULTISPECIES: peroxiredoxin [Acinetobacter]MCU4614925.1 peroxiredoxin [Acinetobacter lwoffii]MDP1316718.1 peroxiredoxin [Acinetobacter lwoffii]NKS46216.1 peroxiredoxin [Acinetobacter lwoffii]QGR74072.1 redoxin domain-containing protein [Acinetobacter lwoffii]QJB49109.1 peroxiredoxin [Acinetobacter sp. NEB149]
MSEMSLLDQNFPATTGEINLTQLNTEWLVIYFYPKDSTPGCTTQAVGFSCLKDQFDALNTTILGVSRDSVKAHQNFTEKQNLSINLISDKEEVLCNHFDVIKEKNMYGKQVMGIERSTFIFHNSQLVKEYRKVKAAGHAEQVLEDLKALQAA